MFLEYITKCTSLKPNSLVLNIHVFIIHQIARPLKSRPVTFFVIVLNYSVIIHTQTYRHTYILHKLIA